MDHPPSPVSPKPPGSCTTPSRVTKVDTLSFLMIALLRLSGSDLQEDDERRETDLDAIVKDFEESPGGRVGAGRRPARRDRGPGRPPARSGRGLHPCPRTVARCPPGRP